MTRALPLLLVLVTVACGELPSQLPTTPDPAAPPAGTHAMLAGAARGGVALMVPNRCADVAFVRVDVGARDEEGLLLTARYETAGRGTPTSRCSHPPRWDATPTLKVVPLKDAFLAYVAAPPDGISDGMYVVSATAPNGSVGSAALTF